MKFKLKIIFIILVSILGCSYGNEEEQIQRAWNIGIGIGYGNISNPFAASDDITTPVILDVSWYGKKFFFDNGELGYTLVDKPNFGINVITTYNTDRIFYSFLNDLGVQFINTGNNFSAVSQPIVNIEEELIDSVLVDPSLINFFEPLPFGNITIPLTLPDRDFSLNLGIELIHDTTFGTFNYQISKDIIATHTGHDFRVNFNKSWQYKRWNFATQLGMHYKSKELVDYYYGIDFNLLNRLNLQYQAKSTIDALMGFNISYRITNQWSIVGNYQLTLFGPAIDNSPLTVDSHKQTLFTGLLYRF